MIYLHGFGLLGFFVFLFFFVSFGGCYFDFIGVVAVVVVLWFCCFVVLLLLLWCVVVVWFVVFFGCFLGAGCCLFLLFCCCCCDVVVVIVVVVVVMLLLCCWLLFVVVVAASPKGQQQQKITENTFIFQYVWDFFGEGCFRDKATKNKQFFQYFVPFLSSVLPSFLSCFPLFFVLPSFLSIFLPPSLASKSKKQKKEERERKRATGRKRRQKEDKQDEKGKHYQNICISGLNIIKRLFIIFMFLRVLRLTRGQTLQFWGAPQNACFCRKEAKVDQRSPPSIEGGDL